MPVPLRNARMTLRPKWAMGNAWRFSKRPLHRPAVGAHAFLHSTLIPPPPMAANPLRQWARSMATAVYPFSKTAIIPPNPPPAPTPALRQGKGLMEFLKQTLPPPEKQKWLTTYFAKRHPERIQPGSILTVSLNHAPNTFSGVLLSVRRRGLDTSFVLRNVINRTGVEMQFYPASPHVKDIKIVRRAGGSKAASNNVKTGPRMRRAKLFYLRDSPEKMSAISAGVKG